MRKELFKKAANEVDGDLYDYVDIDKDYVAVLIGDVSGKGVPAAMLMMKTITSFRDFAAPEFNQLTVKMKSTTKTIKTHLLAASELCLLKRL